MLDDVNCGPNDARLSDCDHADTVVRCLHCNDAGAFCTNVRGQYVENIFLLMN